MGHKILGPKLTDLAGMNKLNISWKLVGFHHFEHLIASEHVSYGFFSSTNLFTDFTGNLYF